jgi:hypothetical protein
MVVQANTGNVGIGTSDPQAKLEVAGRTRMGSLEITGGADFAENFDVNVETTSGEEIIVCSPLSALHILQRHRRRTSARISMN